jgi:hypothetical protein
MSAGIWQGSSTGDQHQRIGCMTLFSTGQRVPGNNLLGLHAYTCFYDGGRVQHTIKQGACYTRALCSLFLAYTSHQPAAHDAQAH